MTIQIQDTLVFRGMNYPVTDIDITKSHWIQVTNYVSQKAKISICWKGYVAKWSIVNDTLVLKDLTIFWSGRRAPLEFDELFPEDSQGVEASWFSGSVQLPDGGELETTDPLTTPDDFRHFIPERTLTLNIVDGRLKSVDERRNTVHEYNQSEQGILENFILKKALKPLKQPPRQSQRVPQHSPPIDTPPPDSELDRFGLMAMSGQMTEKSREDWANFFELNYSRADDGDKAIMDVLNKSIMQNNKK